MADNGIQQYLNLLQTLAEKDVAYASVLQAVKQEYELALRLGQNRYTSESEYTDDSSKFPLPLVFRQEGEIINQEKELVQSPEYPTNLYVYPLTYTNVGYPWTQADYDDPDKTAMKTRLNVADFNSLLYANAEYVTVQANTGYRNNFDSINAKDYAKNASNPLAKNYQNDVAWRDPKVEGSRYNKIGQWYSSNKDMRTQSAKNLLIDYKQKALTNPRFNRHINPAYFVQLTESFSQNDQFVRDISVDKENQKIDLKAISDSIDVNTGEKISYIELDTSQGQPSEVDSKGNPITVPTTFATLQQYNDAVKKYSSLATVPVRRVSVLRDSDPSVFYDMFVDQMFYTSNPKTYGDWKSIIQREMNSWYPFFDYIQFDSSSKVWVNVDTQKNIDPSLAFTIDKFLLTADEEKQAHKYDDLYVHVGNTGYATYWDSLLPEAQKAGRIFLDTINNIVDHDLGPAGILVNNISKSFGFDLQKKKDDAINDLESKFLTVDSEDPEYGAHYGMSIGQTRGAEFKTVLQGFFNSGENRDLKEGTIDWTFKKEFNRIFKNEKDTTPNNNPVEDRINWHVPHTNAAQYGIDHRLQFGSKIKSDDNNIMNLLRDAQAKFTLPFPNQDIITDILKGGWQGIKNIAGAAIDTVGMIGSDLVGTVSTLAGNGSQTAQSALSKIAGVGNGETGSDDTFFSRFVPSLGNSNQDVSSFDKSISVILRGDNNQPEVGPLIALQTHRDYVENNPVAQGGKWFSVDTVVRLEKDSANFMTNYAIERALNVTHPNIKSDKASQILKQKKGLAETNQMFEGQQDVDGSYVSVTGAVGYTNGFDPDNGLFMPHANVMANVPRSQIQTMMGEDNDKPRNFGALSPEAMALGEPQYFPMYIRTISRDDYAIVQQPYYDTNAVFMSKRRVSGNSIVFLDATVSDITEGFASQIDSETYLGRVEPIYTYRGTQRTFAFSFTLPASSPQDIPAIRQQTNTIISMLYPQQQVIREVGVIGFRRGPMVEIRIGDQWLLHGMIQSLNLEHGLDSKIWETLPGGRVLRGCKFSVTLLVSHREQPGAHTDFYSPTFKPSVFYPQG